MHKSIVVFDKYIVSTFWAKIIRVIITEYVTNLEVYYKDVAYDLTWKER